MNNAPKSPDNEIIHELLFRSVQATAPLVDFDEWFDDRRNEHGFKVIPTSLESLDHWSFSNETGNLEHDSRRFFCVEGMRISLDGKQSEQPTIWQPEVGILGIIMKTFDGVPHFLLQAKMEPGNPGLLQLAPTVQATYSNYTRVHGGKKVRYLEAFQHFRSGQILTDVLQSENGCWFHNKRNRNMILQVHENLEPHPDFYWLTLGQIGSLLLRDNLLNMDTRSVLACLPFFGPYDLEGQNSSSAELLTDIEMRSWFTAELARPGPRIERRGLKQLSEWRLEAGKISHISGQFFDIVGVEVHAPTREVSRWSQPMLQPHGRALAALFIRRIQGRIHVLARASAEPGLSGGLEIGPSVQYIPGDSSDSGSSFYLELAQDGQSTKVHYDAIHSDEGGRFRNSECRYLILETESIPLSTPSEYAWLSPRQLTGLAQHRSYLNIQLRTLLACLTLGTARS